MVQQIEMELFVGWLICELKLMVAQAAQPVSKHK
jgi:hypothetical protein